MSEYLEFVETGDTGKTKVFMVRSLHGGANLGEIRWYTTWRQYVFMPTRVTVWNTDCLDTISSFIVKLMAEWRRGLTRPGFLNAETARWKARALDAEERIQSLE